MMSRFTLLFFIVLLVHSTGVGQVNLLSIDQLQTEVKVTPKPTLLLLHTSWCSYCALQKRELSKASFNASVYFAQFDAEYKDDVVFNNKRYSFAPNGKGVGVHQLVNMLLDNKPTSYPSWIILSPNLDVLGSYSGYLKNEEIQTIIDDL